jgi:hypothetical protein
MVEAEGAVSQSTGFLPQHRLSEASWQGGLALSLGVIAACGVRSLLARGPTAGHNRLQGPEPRLEHRLWAWGDYP